MTAPRLSEVTARVVAWHNRHPLARRIDPTQVHSIGEVLLPFASATPFGVAANQHLPAAPRVVIAVPAPSTPAGASLAEALAQRMARPQSAAPHDSGGIDGLDVQSMLPAIADELLATTAPGAATPPTGENIDLALDAPEAVDANDDDGDGEAALVIPLLDGDHAEHDPAADAAEVAQRDTSPAAATPQDTNTNTNTSPSAVPNLEVAEVYPPPHGQVPASALARAVERRAAARGGAAAAAAAELQGASAGHGVQGEQHTPPAEHTQGAPAGPMAAPEACNTTPGNRWQRLVQALRTALTGRQRGMPPLRAVFSQDFIWPLRPGQVARWAQRHGQPWPLAPADWPRRQVDTDRARLARLRQKGLAHDLPLHVLSAAIGVGDRRMRVLLGADGSIIGPRAYSRARVGSAAMLLAVGLVGAGWALRPLHGLGDSGAAAWAALPASAASSASAAPSASAASAAFIASAASSALAAAAPASATALADAASAAASADGQAEAVAAADSAASHPQADIRPTLSDEQRYTARAEAAKLRGDPPPPPPPSLEAAAAAAAGPVYAVVSPASRQRETAATSLVLMQSAAARLAGTVPEHGELVQSQGQWRAAWWPFASLVDAERARVLLAGRGLKAEVVEF